MRLDCAPAANLTERDWQTWDAIRNDTPGLSSPYFASEFCRAVARCSPDLFVARISVSREVVGFFPFHRSRWSTGWPLAKWLSDYHGLIARDDLAIDLLDLVKGCGLKTFDFDHVPATQRSFLRFSRGSSPSHTIDLRAGFDDYVANVNGRSSILRATWRRRRQLAREMGSVRFVYQTEHPAALSTLMKLKSLQYARTGARDLFADWWTVELLETVLRAQGPRLSGVLSVLLVDEQIAALLLSIRSMNVLHCWFSAYDTKFARCSPGIILLLDLAKAAPTHGVDIVDLGRGTYPYKARLATGTVDLLHGRIERPSAVAAWRTARRGVRRLAGWLSSGRPGYS
jgi:CelD/BcsL family acetyltransferase involved in cellulose biosynthesis